MPGVGADQTARGITRLTGNATLAVDYDLPLGGGWRGTVSPGLTARRVTGALSQSFDLSPILSASSGGNGHTMRASYNRLFRPRAG